MVNGIWCQVTKDLPAEAEMKRCSEKLQRTKGIRIVIEIVIWQEGVFFLREPLQVAVPSWQAEVIVRRTIKSEQAANNQAEPNQ